MVLTYQNHWEKNVFVWDFRELESSPSREYWSRFISLTLRFIHRNARWEGKTNKLWAHKFYLAGRQAECPAHLCLRNKGRKDNLVNTLIEKQQSERQNRVTDQIPNYLHVAIAITLSSSPPPLPSLNKVIQFEKLQTWKYNKNQRNIWLIRLVLIKFFQYELFVHFNLCPWIISKKTINSIYLLRYILFLWNRSRYNRNFSGII